MKTAFTNKFLTQISSVRFKTIRKKVEKVILEVENADSLSQIKNLKIKRRNQVFQDKNW